MKRKGNAWCNLFEVEFIFTVVLAIETIPWEIANESTTLCCKLEAKIHRAYMYKQAPHCATKTRDLRKITGDYYRYTI